MAHMSLYTCPTPYARILGQESLSLPVAAGSTPAELTRAGNADEETDRVSCYTQTDSDTARRQGAHSALVYQMSNCNPLQKKHADIMKRNLRGIRKDLIHFPCFRSRCSSGKTKTQLSHLDRGVRNETRSVKLAKPCQKPMLAGVVFLHQS